MHALGMKLISSIRNLYFLLRDTLLASTWSFKFSLSIWLIQNHLLNLSSDNAVCRIVVVAIWTISAHQNLLILITHVLLLIIWNSNLHVGQTLAVFVVSHEMISRILVIASYSILETTLWENLLALVVIDDVYLISNNESCMLLLSTYDGIIVAYISSQYLLFISCV